MSCPFRHVVRSNCGHKLKTEPILKLANLIPQCYQNLEQDLKQFCLFLEREARNQGYRTQYEQPKEQLQQIPELIDLEKT